MYSLPTDSLPIREGAKRKISTRDPILGGSCVPKPLPLKDSDFAGVPQAARKIKGAKIEGGGGGIKKPEA